MKTLTSEEAVLAAVSEETAADTAETAVEGESTAPEIITETKIEINYYLPYN